MDQRLTDASEDLEARLEAGTTVGLPNGSVLVGGAVDPAQTQMKWQAASTVVATDANGFATIAYPTAFSNGVVSVTVVNGSAEFGSMTVGVLAEQCTTSGFVALVTDADGAPVINGLRRFNWTAVGW